MTQATSALLAIATAILWGIAALHISMQLEAGVEWKDLKLVVPLCLGGVGLGLVLGPFFGWFHDANAGEAGHGETDNETEDQETETDKSDSATGEAADVD